MNKEILDESVVITTRVSLLEEKLKKIENNFQKEEKLVKKQDNRFFDRIVKENQSG